MQGINKAYGFIAQEVKEVFPEAVNYKKNAVPNIYKCVPFVRLAECRVQLNLGPDHKMVSGDELELRDIDDMIKHANVTSVDDTCVEVTLNAEIQGKDGTIFVYGSIVPDFHNIVSDYLYTLNVRATQELAERVSILEQKVDALLDVVTRTDFNLR
jgi:hypothetical protein